MGFGRFDTVYIGAETSSAGQGLEKVYSLYIGIGKWGAEMNSAGQGLGCWIHFSRTRFGGKVNWKTIDVV